MSYTGNKVFNVYINSANRSPVEKSYDFNIYSDYTYPNRLCKDHRITFIPKNNFRYDKWLI